MFVGHAVAWLAGYYAEGAGVVPHGPADVVLFQGDLVTDAGRSRTETQTETANALGYGYAFITASELLAKNPAHNLQILNRGVYGDKVYQLANRWDADCLALKPNVLSILIGVNDFWHTLNSGYKGTIETYRNDFIKLLDRTRQALPDVKLIIGEPFAISGVRFVNRYWYPTFTAYRLTAREVADTYHATFIPYQDIFDEAVKAAPAAYWTTDGINPSVAGQSLMAQAWLDAVK